MKKMLFTILLLGVTINTQAQGYDFSAMCNTGQTLLYKITGDSTVSVRSGNGVGGRMEIPDQVSYNGITYYVTSIQDNAFYGCSSLTYIYIPNTVVDIGVFSFASCGNIDTLFLGKNIQQISAACFHCTGINTLIYNCKNLLNRPITGSIRRTFVSYLDHNPPCGYYLTDSWNQYVYYYYHADPFYSLYGSVQHIIIGNDVETIPQSMFRWYTNVVSFEWSDNMVSVGVSSFKDCTWLTAIGNLNHIGDSAFYGCINLDSFVTSHDSIFFGDESFGNCPNLVHFEFNNDNIVLNGVPSSNWSQNNINLTIGNQVRLFNTTLFNNCNIDTLFFNATDCYSFNSEYLFEGSSVSHLHIGVNVRRFPDKAFSVINNIGNIVFPDSLRHIGNQCFINNSSLFIDFPIVTDSIGDSAFYGCIGIDSLCIGSGVQTIGASAFSSCTGLKYLFYNAQNCNNGTFPVGTVSPFYNTPLLTTLVIGDSVETIPNNAFYNCSSINNLQIRATVQKIGDNAFRGCSGIHQLIIPDGVISIGDNAFYGCSGIDSLLIGNGITTIENGVFYGCSSIQKLVIPANITSIGNDAFYGCTGIEKMSFGNGLESIGNSAFQGCNGFSKLVIPESVNSIGSNAFYGCTSIDSLYIGSGVQTIGSGAFRGCTGLQWLNYNALDLPAQGFYGCTQLTTLILGNTVQSIGNEAFYNCDNLLMANINTNNLGRKAFADCDRLVSVSLGDSVRTLGNGVFSGCFRLQNVDLGGTTTLGDSVFSGCVRLESPELPDNLTTIGTRAFNGCSLLAGKLTFPATIINIGNNAYNGTGIITEIEMLGATPPTIYANTFASVSNSTPVSVPCGSVLSYYTTNYWESFSTIVEAPPFKLTVASNNETMGSAAVTQQPTCNNYSAIIQATAETGYHFIQWNDGNAANPRTIQMTQDSSFTAIFVPNNSYIVIEPNDPTMGTTTGTGTYSYNAPVAMAATAYSGYHFLKWNDGNTQNPRYMAAVRDTQFTAIFVSNVSTITVTNANPEWGNVGGSGVYYYQNLVSLTATPNYGYHFSQWSDGNTQNPRTITVAQDSTFTAYFSVNTYSIVASSNSTTMGSVSGGGNYTYLHEMSLTATPAYGYHFVQWNDQNTDNPRSITVTRDSAFTAQFAANSYTITSEPNDPTMGSAYGSGTYNFNTAATLSAVAEYGYHFTQWSDGVTDNPRTITVQNSATYTALFEINSYIITVQSSNPAIGTTSGGGSYNYLTPVNITAIPNTGYHFTQWSDGNTDNPRLVSVTQNATYTAQFAINSYAVSVTSNNSNMGSVSGSGTYNHNSTATLVATAYYGYHFVQWQDGNTENPRTVVVTDSTQYTAQFNYYSYLITANSSNVMLGSATGGGSYNYLTQVALTAVPMPHYHFTMWNDSIEDNPRTITVTRDSIFTAHFVIDTHTVTVNGSGAMGLAGIESAGTQTPTMSVAYNTAVWISATANYGYHFTQWNDGNTGNPRRVVVLQDTSFIASFAPNQYSATFASVDSVMGTVSSEGGNYDYLTALTVTAQANYGYHFTQWNDGATDNPRILTLTNDTSLTALFAANIYHVTLLSNDTTMGTLQGTGDYNYLSQVTIEAIASSHCHFLQWNDGNTTNPRMLTVTSDTSFTAIFEQDQQFQITVNANDTSRGNVEGGGTYFLGEIVTISATANEHYYFAQWSDGVTSNPRVVTVTGDVTYTAVFEPVMYTLTVTANDYSMGQVTGGGSYAYGTDVWIETRAFGGYRFLGWDDGVIDEKRVVTVTADATYTALFEPNVRIGDVEEELYMVYVTNGYIVVEGVDDRRVQIYDIMGRRHSLGEQLPTGVYLVRIDNRITKKVIVL